MVTVQEATFVPNADGGELRANVLIGDQKVITTLPASSDGGELSRLVEQLLVKVQEITFMSTPDGGGEIRTTMRIGDRDFVSRVAVDTNDRDLKPVLDKLLGAIGTTIVSRLQAALVQESKR
jgi:hypothetical protein